MNKRVLYYSCQLGGWSTLLLIDLAIKALAGIFITEQIVAVLFLYSIGAAISHFLRKIYKNKLLNTGLGKTVLKITGYSFIASNAVMAICLPILFAAKKLAVEVTLPLSLQLYFSNMLWMSIIFLIWSALYISIIRQRENKQLTQDQASIILKLKEAQLVSLHQQLNPHFMFNCINNIRALILEDPGVARDMLAHMAEMLRYNLKETDNQLVTIAEEVRVARDYIALCSIQLENRLHYQEKIDQASLEIKLPKMIIQLLLENAIKHGINDSIKGGSITLNIMLKDNKTVIHVDNSGQLSSNSSADSTGIGINNITERLRMIYDDQASFTIAEVDNLVRATVIIPNR